MRIAPFVAAASTALMLVLPQASAAPGIHSAAAYPPPARWCLNESGYTTGECVYPTLEQCLQDRSGEGGYCSPNPSGPAVSRRR
jgi:Protein of unknown function (DUF3551)